MGKKLKEITADIQYWAELGRAISGEVVGIVESQSPAFPELQSGQFICRKSAERDDVEEYKSGYILERFFYE